MNISQILKLNNDLENLNTIQDFLSNSVTHSDYETAIYMYLKIAFFNNLNELIISQGKQALVKIKNQEPTIYKEQIIKYIIDSMILLKEYSEVDELIEERKKCLPIMKQYLSLLDIYYLNKSLGSDLLEILLKLKIEVLPIDISIFVHEELLSYYLLKEDYLNALDIILQLKDLSLRDIYEEKLISIYYYLDDYKKVIDLSTKQIEDSKINPQIIAYLIDALTKTNKLRHASTIEAEYESFIDNEQDVLVKEFAYNAIINLYTILNNNISIDLYKNKLRRIKRKKVTQTPSKEVEEVVVKQDKLIVKEIVTNNLVSNAKYLEHFEWVLKWLIMSHNIDLKVPFREYLREIFIIINKEINFKEAILYIDNNYESNFYNYKKERLYDKKVIKQFIEGSVISDVLNKKESIFNKPSVLINKKDVLTQADFTKDISYVYSFYINDFSNITFYIEDEVKDPSIYYEVFNGIKSIIETRMIDEYNISRLQKEARSLTSILNNSIMPVRTLYEFKSVYNEEAVKLLHVDGKLHLELFLRDIPLDQAKEYSETIKRLRTYPNETKKLTYNFKDLIIEEYMFAYKQNEEVIITSFFTNITNNKEKQDYLTNQAFIDSETKLNNKHALNKDFTKYLKDKATFILIELNDDLKDIYGAAQLNSFFIEFCNITRLHFSNYPIYRYNFTSLIIVFDFNDIRTVNKELADYFQVINHAKSNVLKYEKFKTNAGVLRYPVVTVEKSIDKLYRYLDVSLNKSKLSRNNDFVHFIHADYEAEVFEQEIIDYLNTAIENKQLDIIFKQIIDVSNNVVWNYESMIYLPTINIDNNYLRIIAKKRKKLKELEMFHIEAVCSFLNKLEKETKHLIKLTIPISAETFLSNEFAGFLIATLKLYKVPAEFIRILVDLDSTSQKDSVKIKEILDFGISLDTTNVETSLSNNFNAVHLKVSNLNSKWKKYYQSINTTLNDSNIALVIKDVKTREIRDSLKSLGIKYISGDIYQSIAPIDLISKIKENIK